MTSDPILPVEAQAVPDLPVAIRYLDRNGRWRFLKFPFTKGWEFPMSLGTPEFLFTRPTPAAAAAQQEQRHSVHLAGDEAGRTSVAGGVNAPSAEVPEHFIAQLRDAARYLLQNGQTKQGLAVQACVTMLEDDSND